MPTEANRDMSAVGFVRASVHRSSLMLSLLDWPKTTGQISLSCAISAAHASRAIRELVTWGLVECVTPNLRGRGRLYGLTDSGSRTVESFHWGPAGLRTPMVRGTHPKAWYQAVVNRFGLARAGALIRDLNLIPAVGSPSRRWIPLRVQMKLLEEIERRFGDGSYAVVRALAIDSVQYYPSVRRYLLRALPWHIILEMGASAYLREFNHGRVEVEIHGDRALTKHFDWLSSPARCAAWLGSWEGLLLMRKLAGNVEKRGCILLGDEYCGYVLSWHEAKSN